MSSAVAPSYPAREFSPVEWATGVGVCEGPVILESGEVVVVSQTAGCLIAIDSNGATRVYAKTWGGPNGLTLGPGGRVYVAQVGWRGHANQERRLTGGVQVVEPNGEVSYLTQDLISPNDLCFGPDGHLYVTDPTRPIERTDGRLWRVDVATGEATLLASVDWFPNGIGFGPEDDVVYVAATDRRCIYRMVLLDDDRLGEPEEFARLPYGLPDGFAFDTDGNLVLCAPMIDGKSPGEVQVYDRNGNVIDRRRPGSSGKYTNVAIDDSGTAYVTDTDKGQVLRIEGWANTGLPLHPFREAVHSGERRVS